MQTRNGARELGLIVATLAALSRFVADAPLWVTTALAAVVAIAGTASLVGELRPWRWPLDRVALPATAAFVSIGIARLVDPVPWLAVAFAGSWAITAWVVSVEIAAATRGGRPGSVMPDGTHARPTSARLGAFGLAFLGFVAIGGIVPGGVAGDGQPLTVAAFLATIVLDVAIGGLAGYRIAAVRPHTPGQAVVAFYQYSMVVAPIGVLVRVLALPRLFGPAVLALATYLVTSLRESEEPVRFNARLLEETGVLVLAGVAVVVLGLLVK
ncbi:MAG: hypothetical protein ABSD62_03625 [Candidatus Limnocylindrales bacterium]|jgi:hypothetical protein